MYVGKYCFDFDNTDIQLFVFWDDEAMSLEMLESESESFYSVLLQTQETSAKTISGRCRRGHLEKSIHECMYVKIILINKSKS